MIQDSVKMGNDTMFDNEILDHQILITIALLKPDAKYEVRTLPSHRPTDSHHFTRSLLLSLSSLCVDKSSALTDPPASEACPLFTYPPE